MLTINSSKSELMSEIEGKIVLALIGILNFVFIASFVFYLRLEIKKNERGSPETGMLIKILALLLFVKLKDPITKASQKMVNSMVLTKSPLEMSIGKKREENDPPESPVGNFSF